MDTRHRTGVGAREGTRKSGGDCQTTARGESVGGESEGRLREVLSFVEDEL